MKKKFDAYSVLLHVALVGLSALVIGLVLENRQLQRLLAPPDSGPEVGQTVAELPVTQLGGDEAVLNFTATGRDHLLLVFTTDCPACRENQSAWRTLHEQVGDNMEVVGISLSELEATRGYRDRHSLSFPVAVPTDSDRFAESLSISAIPMTIRIGPDGRVNGSWSGSLSAAQVAEVSSTERG